MKNLIIKLLVFQATIKLIHWNPSNPGQVGSNAEHETLGDLYDSLDGKIDLLVETYQGLTGELLDISYKTEISKKSIPEIFSFVLNNFNTDYDKQDSVIQNILDEIKSDIHKAAFKLKFLK